MRVRVIGAGVAGLCAAYALARKGVDVEIVERERGPGLGCSRFAGGMIAPWCELESAEPLVATLGEEALDFWSRDIGVATVAGSLVVAPRRERAELFDFARRTRNFETLDGAEIGALEPDLAGRFEAGLFFRKEAHLDPRAAMAALVGRLARMPNVAFRFAQDGAEPAPAADWTVDCRGLAAREALPGLRGVKGEMLILRGEEISFTRPVRMLHPRRPVYVVPRGEGLFMVGATMIENEERARVTARSIVELVNSAFAIHPAFAEAEIVETGSDLRPAFADNLPRLLKRDRALYINGLYRHGFLLAPAMARRVAEVVVNDGYFPEVMDAHSNQRAAPGRAGHHIANAAAGTGV
ncbi:MAG: FAD-dependent oxidoreductase [Methylocystis sp.]|uniref:FAD-dependent oxidoreductase n=1 Tax=Methylocystis sp. TaxID=1911079 RepID=UPI00392ECF71